jgi:hypothetical protein
MALVGHTAASMNIFLDIPMLLRAVSQAMYNKAGPLSLINIHTLEQMEQVDPKDPTGIVDEYFGDWWNFESEWKTHSVEVNQMDAFLWHLKKVKKLN